MATNDKAQTEAIENGAEGESDVEVTESADTTEETTTKTQEKPKESPEARISRLRRQLEREEKKLGIAKDTPEPTESKPQNSGDFDYGQKAYLRSFDIKGSDELQLAKDWMRRTGDTLDSMVEDDIFLGKLKSLREAKATAEAIPKTSKRSPQPAQDDVQFWLSKPFNEVPQDMKRKVLNAKIKSERDDNKFSSNPIVSS